MLNYLGVIEETDRSSYGQVNLDHCSCTWGHAQSDSAVLLQLQRVFQSLHPWPYLAVS